MIQSQKKLIYLGVLARKVIVKVKQRILRAGTLVIHFRLNDAVTRVTTNQSKRDVAVVIIIIIVVINIMRGYVVQATSSSVVRLHSFLDL